ncbi:transposable element Tcb2 transposase [Trichonephila clavipes]|uniref:Transposable element Tcb2 transposase n=1 Tax=Trichonephila clavipes TaxID=2585209 RepID=A0A8X6V6Z5_TRICX|nr:transposable element Tcb2 transposase [Trichonephila clavipes]
MQRDCALRIAGRGQLTSFSVEYKIGNQSLFEWAESFTRAEVDISLCRFRRRYEQLSQFERGRINGMMEAKWSARLVARQLGHSDCVPTASLTAIQTQVAPSLGTLVSSRTIRRHLAEGHLGSRRPLRELPLTPAHRRLSLEWCRARGNWTAVEWNQVVFSDESRFNLSSDDNRVRVLRPHGERLNPAFAFQRHTAPTTAAPGGSFFNDNARPHTERVSQDCLRTVTTLPWPARSPDLSPVEHNWDHLGWRVGHPTSLNELKARLQQIWNEMSQDVIQNLYASMPDRMFLKEEVACVNCILLTCIEKMDISLRKRTRIVTLGQHTSTTVRDIAEAVGVGKSSASRIINQ